MLATINTTDTTIMHHTQRLTETFNSQFTAFNTVHDRMWSEKWWRTIQTELWQLYQVVLNFRHLLLWHVNRLGIQAPESFGKLWEIVSLSQIFWPNCEINCHWFVENSFHYNSMWVKLQNIRVVTFTLYILFPNKLMCDDDNILKRQNPTWKLLEFDGALDDVVVAREDYSRKAKQTKQQICMFTHRSTQSLSGL